jgi:hypothetical protein
LGSKGLSHSETFTDSDQEEDEFGLTPHPGKPTMPSTGEEEGLPLPRGGKRRSKGRSQSTSLRWFIKRNFHERSCGKQEMGLAESYFRILEFDIAACSASK